MDPKHQFAAQYMLSRAAAERREQIATGGSSLLSIGQNSRSPSVHSDTSSCNGRLSSPPEHNDNNNNGSNNGCSGDASDNNNNANNLSVGNYNGKLSVNDVLRSQTSGHLHQQYQQVVAAANAITAAQNHNSCNGLGSPGNPATSAAQAVVNLAAAMRQNQSMSNGNQQSSPSHYHSQNNQSMSHHGHQAHSHHGHQEPADAAFRIQDVLRGQAEAALRLAVSTIASNGNGNDVSSNNQYRHHHNGSSYNHHHQSNLQSQFTPDLSQALQALRHHQNP